MFFAAQRKFMISRRSTCLAAVLQLTTCAALHSYQLLTSSSAHASQLASAALELGAASASWDVAANGVQLLAHDEDDGALLLQTLATAADPGYELVEDSPLFDPDDWAAAAAEPGFAPFLERPLHVAPVQSPQPPPDGAGYWRSLRLLEGDAFMLTTAGALHATTRMIVRLLCERRAELFGPASGCNTVLDYGCGSGVLALAALLLGPTELRAVGTDVSEAALGCAARNAQINVCRQHPRAESPHRPTPPPTQLPRPPAKPSLRPAAHPCDPPRPWMPQGLSDRLDVALPWELPRSLRARLAVANMLPGPLISVAADLAASTAPGATLIVTGFQRRDLAAVADALAPCFEVPEQPTLEREGWLSLLCTRTDAPVQWRRD